MISKNEFENFKRKFDAGDYDHQRFGQAFENTYKGLCPELGDFGDESPVCVFYLQDRKEVEKKILENHVQSE